MDHNDTNKSKKETLKSYTDYSGLKGTQAKIEQYKNLLDFLIKDCKDLIVEGIHSNAPYEDPEEELERWLDDLKYRKARLYPCDNDELSKLYGYDHGLIIPDELKTFYEEIGCLEIGADDAELHLFNPSRVLFAKSFNTFLEDADDFAGLNQFINKDRYDFLSQNYAYIGRSRSFVGRSYILLEKSGRGFITLELDETDYYGTMDEDVELLCNPETTEFNSLDEAIAQGFFDASDGLLRELGLRD